ncbi:Plasmid stabilisation system protein [Serratia plymuthica]|nr:Plasmid stabilisation system protein [Serratia plymuthica]
MTLKWTEPAIADRMAIYDYLETKNPAAATRLSQNPSSGKPGQVPGTREMVIHHSYFLVYELTNGLIIMLAVVHTRRQWPAN